MKAPIRIAHLSDLHFSKICLNPFQIFSKRILGNANLLLRRGRIHINPKPFSLPALFEKLDVHDVLISGDFTTTAQKSEYAIARELIKQLQDLSMRVAMVPGNHDHYTRRTTRKRIFYSELPEPMPSTSLKEFSLKRDRVSAYRLSPDYWVVALDTTMYNPFVDATGDYTDEIDQNLRKLLTHIPKEEKIILMNHFPFFCNDKFKRRLIGGEKLEKLLRETPNILLYLHGHTHRRTIADLRPDGLPIVLDCGSVSHANHGSWNLIELHEKEIKLQVYSSSDRTGENWKCIQEECFTV